MLRVWFSIPVVVAMLLGNIARAEENWPQFRGPTANAHASSQNLPLEWSEEKNITWKTAIHDRGWSSPVVFDGQIWLTTAKPDGKSMYAICVDKASGKILHDIHLWDVEKPSEIHATNSYASPTPVIEKGRVYVNFGSYGTAAIDTASGKVLWTRRDFPCEHWRGPGSSPILHENKLIMHFDGYDHQYIVAVDKATGETIWKVDRNVEYGTDNGDVMKAFCTPLIIEVGGQKQIISSTSKATLAYDLTGKEIWRVTYSSFSSTGMPLWGNGLVYLNTGFGKADLMAVKPEGTGDITGTNVVWKVTKGIGSKPSQLLVGDLIFNVHDAGVANCLDANTGEQVWTTRLGGTFSSSLLYGNGRVYFCAEDGKCTVVAADRELKILAENKLDDGFMATPAVSGDSLLLRTKTHLYCVEQPK
ncbi:Pyrrolo-quinoline quinone [Pirellula staleyi DSM 6068]|uniref:Pyrrolo-quinoline quinone n=1 Tax=Pirellula staleyi (strain ATCC 27377 / DSM 6068 / ICPB 4128) TaxID=530564 RepID=D2QYC9_PIRSD|nr:PQQ-binding-like beta-propeller repeat protein [Pirellula staleyi]ADB16343.1 Pyrrolo-quinoline quinone [Pirellula staleyi DSM 6068]